MEIYNEIDSDEYWVLSANTLWINFREYYLIFNKINQKISENENIISKISTIKRSDQADNIKQTIIIFLRNYNFFGNVITIFLIPDDYYILRFTVPDVIIQYKCDQIEGLFKCIDYVFTQTTL